MVTQMMEKSQKDHRLQLDKLNQRVSELASQLVAMTDNLAVQNDTIEIGRIGANEFNFELIEAAKEDHPVVGEGQELEAQQQVKKEDSMKRRLFLQELSDRMTMTAIGAINK